MIGHDDESGYVPGYPVRRRRTTAARRTALTLGHAVLVGVVLFWAVIVAAVLVAATVGCSAVVNVPAAVADGVGVVDSNVSWLDRRHEKALAELGRGGLQRAPEQDDADEHDRALMAATEELLASLRLWMLQHRERAKERE